MTPRKRSMKATFCLIAAFALLAACADTPSGTSNMIPSGGAAGHMGRDYCQTVPSNPNDRSQWNALCFPGNR